MQIIIYAGAIMVFILFVIMLLDLKGEKSVGGFKFQSAVGLILSFLLLFLLITGSAHMALNGSKMSGSEIESSFGGVRLFGELLFNDYLLSFEVASVLLLIAMIGAVVFGKLDKYYNPLHATIRPRAGNGQFDLVSWS